MRPAIDRDRRDVASRIEASILQHTSQLIANIPFERFEWSGEQFRAPRAILVVLRQPRPARSAHQMHQNGVSRRFGTLIFADVDVRIQMEVREIASRRIDAMDLQPVERQPITQCNTGVHERSLHRLVQRVFLDGRQLGAEIGDQHVVAGQYRAAGSSGVGMALAQISYFDLPCRRRIAQMTGTDYAAVEAKTRRRIGSIECRVVHPCGDDVLDAVARNGARNELAHQEPRDAGIAVGQMKPQ